MYKAYVLVFSAALAALLSLGVPAKADPAAALVVSACAGPTYVAGQSRQLTMDTHGNLCGPSGSVSSPIEITTSDPCEFAAKSTVAISVTSATTTSLVGISGTTAIYVCGGTLTIAPSATAADTALLEYGTGATCGTGTASLTGTFGNGDLTTAAPPIVVVLPSELVTPAAQRLCILTAGTTVNVQGYITYVQQ